MILKCKICGGDIELTEDRTFGTCMYCGCAMTFPKLDDEQRANMFNRGNQFRRMGDFDRAVSVYEQIIQEDDSDAEAHWCCAISRFGIEYVEDPTTFEWMPTCHRLSFESFAEDIDYLAALEHSDGITKKQYIRDAAKIVEVQKGILKTSQSEEPFDIFICYKDSADNGERTEDSVLAQDIYYRLTDRGYRVFFSRITLEDKAGMEFEPYIFAALNSAKVMIVIGTKKEYLNAVWVKNEWSRYLALMRKDREKVILPCYKDMDPYDMPEALSILQSYDMTKIGFAQDLLHGIGKIVDKKPKNENQINPVGVDGYQAASKDALLKRTLMFLEDGDFSVANEFCEKVLNLDPENSTAYFYKAMAVNGFRSGIELAKLGEGIKSDANFNRALRFADAETQPKLKKIMEKAYEFECETKYQYACDLALTTLDLSKVCEACLIFGEMKGYKDSDEKKNALEKEYIDPQFEAAVAKFKSASSYYAMKKVLPVFETVSICKPEAKEYIAKIKEMEYDWRMVFADILENEESYKTAKEIVDEIKRRCPEIFDEPEFENLAKDFEECTYIERLYGTAKSSALKIVREAYEKLV